jgi:hypothetical protein
LCSDKLRVIIVVIIGKMCLSCGYTQHTVSIFIIRIHINICNVARRAEAAKEAHAGSSSSHVSSRFIVCNYANFSQSFMHSVTISHHYCLGSESAQRSIPVSKFTGCWHGCESKSWAEPWGSWARSTQVLQKFYPSR